MSIPSTLLVVTPTKLPPSGRSGSNPDTHSASAQRSLAFDHTRRVQKSSYCCKSGRSQALSIVLSASPGVRTDSSGAVLSTASMATPLAWPARSATSVALLSYSVRPRRGVALTRPTSKGFSSIWKVELGGILASAFSFLCLGL